VTTWGHEPGATGYNPPKIQAVYFLVNDKKLDKWSLEKFSQIKDILFISHFCIMLKRNDRNLTSL